MGKRIEEKKDLFNLVTTNKHNQSLADIVKFIDKNHLKMI